MLSPVCNNASAIPLPLRRRNLTPEITQAAEAVTLLEPKREARLASVAVLLFTLRCGAALHLRKSVLPGRVVAPL